MCIIKVPTQPKGTGHTQRLFCQSAPTNTSRGHMNYKLSFSYEQYLQWSVESKQAPLPRKYIELGAKTVEVFALPGYEKQAGRYIYSGTSATEATCKPRNALLQFLRSKSPLALPYKDFNLLQFAVDGSDIPIAGYPSTIVFSYWLHQLSKGNLEIADTLNALGSTSLDLLADSVFGIDRKIAEFERLIQQRLFTVEAVEYKTHFFPNYYSELYRIFKLEKNGRGRPGIFAQVTRVCFYSLFPGQANDIFDERNPNRTFYNHQFLTEDGNKIFNQVMNSFLTFLRGCPSGKWNTFLTHYQNTYGAGFQESLDLEL